MASYRTIEYAQHTMKTLFSKRKYGVYISGIFLIGAVALLGYHFLGNRTMPETETAPDTSRIAPEISLPNAQGQMVSLSTLQTPLRIIYFWASWSPYTKTDMPIYAELQANFEGDLEIFAVNRDRNSRDGQNSLKDMQLTDRITIVYDEKDEYFDLMVGFGVPETLFIDKGRNILHRVHGPMTKEELYSTVQDLLARESS